ncbi:MAG: DHH family phosphoesterase [Candidatus Gracilibacteria bacterium]|nr:DHH family phosphoesterase [Candidatus Gracilibacteria bacterium]
MDLSLNKQIIALIERSENILLCTHRKPDGDAVGSIMAMHKALKQLGKKVTALCSDMLPESFDFLPEVNQVGQNIGSGRDFVVTLDCDETEVDRLKYHLEDNKIHIVITPKQGRFQEENVSFSQGDNHFDLIITVDVADIPQLGKIYDENADLFTSVPVVNIDHHISNTQFGKVNLIDVASSSTAEILFGLIRDMESHFNKTLITADTATFLLSGITTDTGSFQNSNTTPKAMQIAAELMDAGANQQDIIKYLFRTKKLETLKLYGRILSKIEVDPAHRLVWSSITQQDLKSSGADMEDAAGIIDELMVHAPEAEIIALFKEQTDMVSVSFRSTTDQADVMEIASKFGGGGHVRAAGAKLPGKSLPQVSNEVLAALQAYQQKRLGLSGESGAPENEPEITQVLDGYTQPSTPGPSLEEKAKAQVVEPVVPSTNPTPFKKVTEQAMTPETPSPSKGEQSTTTAQQPVKTDEQGRAKAAIEAEQAQPTAGGPSFSPSGEALKQTPKRPREKRFTNELPDFLRADTPVKPVEDAKPVPPPAPPIPKPEVKPAPPVATQPEVKAGQAPVVPPAARQAPEVPPTVVEPPQTAAPPVQPPLQKPAPITQPPVVPNPLQGEPNTTPPKAMPEDDGVSVKMAPVRQVTAPPSIPKDSAEPTVKTVTPPSKSQDSQAISDALSGFGGGPTPPPGSGAATGSGGQSTKSDGDDDDTKPAPPKDPFALGDDGMTDIERALGGL